MTARRLVASPVFSLLTNGKTILDNEVVALHNFDKVNRLIRHAKQEEYPHGTDVAGVQFLQHSQSRDDPYIRTVEHFSDGNFIILCQFKAQSHRFSISHEIHVDKTFNQAINCDEIEFNSWDSISGSIITLSRVFTNYNDGDGYFKVFSKVFAQTEEDVGQKLKWGHIYTDELEEGRIRAILVDEDGGQIKGLGMYFANEFKQHDADWHVHHIVKVCQIHYKRSVNALLHKGTPKGF